MINMTLLSGLRGITGRLGGMAGIPLPSRTPTQKGFAKTLTTADFFTSATATVSTGFTKLGSYTVPAQQAVHWGYGSASLPDNQGYIYLKLADSTAHTDVDGVIRLVQANAQETRTEVVFEERTDALDGSTTDRQNMIALPEQTQFDLVGEDSLLIIQFRPDTSATVSATATSTIIRLPVTVYQ